MGGTMKKDRIIAALAIICAFSVIMMVVTLKRTDPVVLFTPPPFDPTAESGIPDVPSGMGYQELDVQVFRVSLSGEIHVRDGAAGVWLANPEGNNVWLKVRILDQEGSILGESGLLRSGEYVQWVETGEIQPGSTVILKVMAYEPETYHSAGALAFHAPIVVE